MNPRDKAILAGLFLAKFDDEGLAELGFKNFSQAKNIIGLAVGIKPNSVKNYRDEFDDKFPNKRQGWKRPMRENARKIYEEYKDLSIAQFAHLLKSFIYADSDVDLLLEKVDETPKNSFAKRLLTGQAAENYFRKNYQKIEIFRDYRLTDTTKLGCGFDFKLHNAEQYIGVEVKGLSEARGSIVLTDKEYRVASSLREKYYLFVVRDFNNKPFHNYFADPTHSNLRFAKNSRDIRQISWTASLME